MHFELAVYAAHTDDLPSEGVDLSTPPAGSGHYFSRPAENMKFQLTLVASLAVACSSEAQPNEGVAHAQIIKG